MQIKTTVRYQLTLVTMAKIKNDKRKQALVKIWRKVSPCVLLVAMEFGAAIVENSTAVPQKIRKYNYPMVQQFHFWVFTQRK